MTLITLQSAGKVIGRCDARCYNGKHKRCRCCCGCKNHGKGLVAAMEETRTIFTEHTAGWTAQGQELKFNDKIFQGTLIA